MALLQAGSPAGTAGAAGPGATTAGAAGPGATTAGAAGPGTTTAGSAGPGTTTAGAAGPGTTTAGSAGPGTTTAGAAGPGTTTAGSAGPGTTTAGAAGPGTTTAADSVAGARATAHSYLMCPPDYFTVEYAINPWMDPGGAPVDRALARRQWDRLRQVYLDLGHTVALIDPVPGLPDMVFAANGATVIGGKVLGARFRYPQRAAEGDAYQDWFRRAGYATVRQPDVINEGEGDLLCTGHAVIAGYGFRTDAAAAHELEELFGLPVVSVRLTDPRFYHLDTALTVLDGDTAAYYPAAFTGRGRAALARLFGTLIAAPERDAAALGLNAVSDGRHVVLPAAATGLAAELARAGFEPVPVEFSEFAKAGGGPKCCTLELRG